MNILLLCDRPYSDASTISDHIDSFAQNSRHSVFTFSNRGFIPPDLDLNRFDVLVIHYSLYILGHVYLDASAKKRIRNFRGLKVQFIQDEYRTVNAIREEMKSLGVEVLFTCFPEDQIGKVYDSESLPGVRTINTLTGYVPPSLLHYPSARIAERPIHVGYRARQVPFWLGRLGAEKWQIVPRFLDAIFSDGLICDLSYEEKDRFYGKRWIHFISSCKAMLGTESGASVIDFTGGIQKAVEDDQEKHPQATFEEIEERFLKSHEGKIRMNQISPRLFEAAALKTALLLYEGEYSGILKPWRHFIPLKKDFSNIREVIRILKDDDELQNLADVTYEEIATNPANSCRNFIENFDTVIEEEFRKRKKETVPEAYCETEFKNVSRIPLWRRQIPTMKRFLRNRKKEKLAILILYWDNWHYPMRMAVRDHLAALRVHFPQNRFFVHNVKFDLPRYFAHRKFDAVLLHNTLLCLRWGARNKEKWQKLASQIAGLRGLKVAIPQDEYDHAHTLDDFLDQAGVSVIFSNFDSRERALLYPRMSRKAEFQQVLTGYLSQRFVRTARVLAKPLSERKIVLGYRGTRLPFWFGRWGEMKSQVALKFKRAAETLGLRSDISVEKADELYGKSWIQFLTSCQAVVGCEGGSSIFDPRGEIQHRVTGYLRNHPSASFEEVEASCFPSEDSRHVFRALSPRHLEACASRTVQILIEGEYSGVLTANRHYLPLKADCSNITEVLKQLENRDACQRMVDTAYEEIVASGRFSDEAFANQIMFTIQRHRRNLNNFETERAVTQADYYRSLVHRGWVHLLRVICRPVYAIGRFFLLRRNQPSSRVAEESKCAV